MNSSLKYTVQIITGAEQLTEALNLRYRTYRKVYPKLTENCNLPYESDVFDSRSIHLGLYCENESENKLAGYCRLVLPEYFKGFYTEYLVQHHDLYPSKNKNKISDRIAFFKYSPDDYNHVINSFCLALERNGQVYAETSRFIIDDEHRSLSLSAFFAQSMFAIATSLKMNYNFFSCHEHHAAFYKKNGLTLFPGLTSYANQIFQRNDLIFGTDLNEANAQQAKIKTLKLQMEEENQITFRRAA